MSKNMSLFKFSKQGLDFFKTYPKTRGSLFVLFNGDRNVDARCRNIFMSSRFREEENDKLRDEGGLKSPKIYTRTGDKGFTSLFTGERRAKSDLVFETLGDVDELTSHIGLSRITIMESWQSENFKDIADKFEKIQCTLQDVNSCVATPQNSSSEARLNRTRFDGSLTDELEEWIDFYTNDLPPLKNFILPSGGKTSSQIHVTRSVCRRAERKLSNLVSSGSVPNDVARYVNRLSDFFFTIARYVAMMEGHVERIYKKPTTRRKTDDEVTPPGTAV